MAKVTIAMGSLPTHLINDFAYELKDRKSPLPTSASAVVTQPPFDPYSEASLSEVSSLNF